MDFAILTLIYLYINRICKDAVKHSTMYYVNEKGALVSNKMQSDYDLLLFRISYGETEDEQSLFYETQYFREEYGENEMYYSLYMSYSLKYNPVTK